MKFAFFQIVLRFPGVFAQHMPPGEVRKVLSFFHCCIGSLFTKSFRLSFGGEQNEGGLLSRREPEVLDWVSPSPWLVSPGCCWGCHTGYVISLAFLRTWLLCAGIFPVTKWKPFSE